MHREEHRDQLRAHRGRIVTLERALGEDVVLGVPFVAPMLSPGLIGDINGGGVEIRLTSMSGSIYVRRGK